MTYYIPFAVFALAAVTALVSVFRYPDRPFTRAEGARIKWFFAGLVVWGMGLRALATEVPHRCAMDGHVLTYRGGLSGFWQCTPQLLAGGPLEMFVFLWAWAPFPVVAAFCIHRLLRMARRPHRVSEES